MPRQLHFKTGFFRECCHAITADAVYMELKFVLMRLEQDSLQDLYAASVVWDALHWQVLFQGPVGVVWRYENNKMYVKGIVCFGFSYS